MQTGSNRRHCSSTSSGLSGGSTGGPFPLQRGEERHVSWGDRLQAPKRHHPGGHQESVQREAPPGHPRRQQPPNQHLVQLQGGC